MGAIMRSGLIGVLLTCAAVSASPVWGADLGQSATSAPAPAPSPSAWTYEATIYGWAAGLSGDMGVGRFPPASVDLSFSDILRHLDGVFMGAFTARNDSYILGADYVWVKLSASKTFGLVTPPAYGGLSVDLGLSEGVGTVFAGYRIPIGSPNLTLYGTLGARIFDLSGSLALAAAPLGFPLERSASGNQTWADPVVGVIGRYRIDERWFLNGEADVGGWSGSATAQGFASIGYNWSKTVSTSLGYRVLYADYNNGASTGFRYRATMNGPVIALTLAF